MTAPSFVYHIDQKAFGYLGSSGGAGYYVYGEWSAWTAQNFEAVSWTPGHYGGGPDDTYEYSIGSTPFYIGSLAYYSGLARTRSATFVPGGSGASYQYIPVTGLALTGAGTSYVGALPGDVVTVIAAYTEGTAVLTLPGFDLIARWTPTPTHPMGMSIFKRTVTANEPTSYQMTVAPYVTALYVTTVIDRNSLGGVIAEIKPQLQAATWTTPNTATDMPDSEILACYYGPALSNSATVSPTFDHWWWNATELIVGRESITGLSSVARSIVPNNVGVGLVATVLVPPLNAPPRKPLFITPGDAAGAAPGSGGNAADMTRHWWLIYQSTDPNGPVDDPPSALRLKAIDSVGGTNYWWNGVNWSATTEQTVTQDAPGILTHFSDGGIIGVEVEANALAQRDWTFQAATRDQAGVWGPYSDAGLVHGHATPGVDLIAPAAIVTDTTKPTLLWLSSEAVRWTARIWTKAAYDASGFSADTTPPWVGSATMILSPLFEWQSRIDLANNTDFVAGVQIANSFGQLSDWDFVDFGMQVPAPSNPFIEAVWETSMARTAIELAISENLLTAIEATGDDTLLWVPLFNAAIDSILTDDAVNGTNVLEIITEAGAASIALGRLVPVRGDTDYSASIAVWTDGVAQDGTLTMRFFDSNFAALTSVSEPFTEGVGSTPGSGSHSAMSSFPAMFGIGMSSDSSTATPASPRFTFHTPTATAWIQFEIGWDDSDDEQLHFVDAATLRRGADGMFRPGGFLDSSRLALLRSVDGGVTFEAVRGGVITVSTYGDGVIYDYEALPGVLAIYRANAVHVLGGLEIAGDPTDAFVLIDQDAPWLKAPTDPTFNVALVRLAMPVQSIPHRIVEHQAPFRREPIIVSTGWGSTRGQLSAYVSNMADEDALLAAIKSDLVLLFQEPPDAGEDVGRQWYVVIGSQAQSSRLIQKRYPDRNVTVPYIEVVAP